jgi:transcriptional antiterminator NusG
MIIKKKKIKEDQIINLEKENLPQWYIIETYSGCEKSVKEDLLKLTHSTTEISKLIFEVIFPKEKYFKIKADGTKKEKEKKMFSDYIFIKMIMNNYSWFIVRNIPKIKGFLGSIKGINNSKPTPLNENEIKPILIKMGLMTKKNYDYLINKKVEIINGSFVGQKGKVSFLDYNQDKLIVEIDLFGRTTPIEISFSDFKEIN